MSARSPNPGPEPRLGSTPPRGDEPALIARVQSGDLEAFEPLYRHHVERVYALCLWMAGNAGQAGPGAGPVLHDIEGYTTRKSPRSKLSRVSDLLGVGLGIEHRGDDSSKRNGHGSSHA